MNPFEALGRATLRAENAEEQVRNFSLIFQKLKAGEMKLDDITVTDTSQPPEVPDVPESDGGGNDGPE